MLNRAQVIGRLTRDPEGRSTPDGTPVTTFDVAVNYRAGEAERVEYVHVKTWRSLAETCAGHLARGRLVYAEGPLSTETWDDAGSRRERAFIVATSVQFLDRPKVADEAP